jgi:predicted AlkP superfamily pyrophosphatase or phosphodiesterase
MRFKKTAINLLICSVLGTVSTHSVAEPENRFPADIRVDHVLLISVDGMHALDLENYVNAHPRSTLAELAGHGIRYTGASSSKPSDSFPGLLAMVTGGSPISTGVFYDVSYDRTLFDPSNTHCNGARGAVTVFDESIDLIDATGRDLDVIDPTKLPRGRNQHGDCVPVFPHDFVKVNTIFEVVKASGRRTAWADKHPAYDLVNGPSGKGVEDLFTPEITNPNGFDATVSVVCTAENDAKKVQAVINQIHGLDHAGRPVGVAPAIFGMNFQAVSVGQKLTHDSADPTCNPTDAARLRGKSGGYLDALAMPTEVLQYGLDKTDAALGAMVEALKRTGLYPRTLMIISAKHGQAPIDPSKVNKPGHLQDLVAALPGSGGNPAAQAIANAAVTDDDVALIWLQDQSQTGAVADFLRANQKALSIQDVLSGESLKLRFNDPHANDRTPDIVVLPDFGTIFSASSKKLAEHGGFSTDDTNVALLVSNPGLLRKVIKTPVLTTQIAPTILKALELDPEELKAVQKEHTRTLPGLGGEE